MCIRVVGIYTGVYYLNCNPTEKKYIEMRRKSKYYHRGIFGHTLNKEYTIWFVSKIVCYAAEQLLQHLRVGSGTYDMHVCLYV